MNRTLNIFKSSVSFSRRAGLFVLFALYSLVAIAQSFPVQVIPQALPPAPIYVSNYADASSVTSPLRVQIILNDFEIANREIRLKTYFTGSGLAFQSNDIVVGASPLFLEGGIPLILTNVELAPYFEFNNITGINASQYGNAIPEGAYQFCVEVYDVLTGSRLSNKSCAVSVVFQNEPPFLVLPKTKTNVDEINPQYIVFQWTPRSINVSNVEYELSLVEIWDNQVDPQQAFLSSPPVFQTTMATTTYVYGPSDPLLLSGKNYAWRVQAKAKQGTEEIGLFKNEGYSEIYSFSYASACELPSAITHEVKGSTNANIIWEDFATEIPEFTVRYRQKGNENEWFESKTTTNLMTLWDLKAGTIYEYQVQKKCSITESIWSLSKQFTTFIADDEDSVYECGINPDFSLTNTDPLDTIGEGEQFVAGDFPIKVLEASGSNGRFTGKGYVTIPYLSSIRVGVEFTNVLINTDKQLVEGSVITMYDPSLKNILDIDEAIDTIDNITDLVGELFEGDNDLDEIRVNFSIPKDKVDDYIKVENGIVTITNPENGASISEPLGDDKVVVDKDGQVYHIDAGGNITEGGQIDAGGAVNSGNVDGVSNNGDITELTAKGIQITFEDTKGRYGFDVIPNTDNSKINKEYTIIPDADGKDYVLVHQAVEKGVTATIRAKIEQPTKIYELTEIVFKTKTGEIIPSKIEGNDILLTVKGNYTFENETIYAVVPSKEDASKQLTAGAFTLWHLTDRVIDIVLVSVDNAPIPNGTESIIQNIFKKGAATINIDRKTATLDTSLLGADGKLEIADSPWLVAYNDEQKAVISNLKSQIDYSANKYYLFVFKNDFQTTKSIAGFMPLQRQFGFLFNGGLGSGDESKGDLGIVAAHEIGHGVFALQHPFTEYGSAKESTDWLMDYKNNKVLLNHMNWAQMHDPALKFYVFQDDEDGEYSFVNLDYVCVPPQYQNRNHTYLDLDGNKIVLGSGFIPIAFVGPKTEEAKGRISIIKELATNSTPSRLYYPLKGTNKQYYWTRDANDKLTIKFENFADSNDNPRLVYVDTDDKVILNGQPTGEIFETARDCPEIPGKNNSTQEVDIRCAQMEHDLEVTPGVISKISQKLLSAISNIDVTKAFSDRTLGTYSHIFTVDGGGNALSNKEKEWEILEDKFHLLSQYRQDTYFVLGLVRTTNNSVYTSEQLRQIADASIGTLEGNKKVIFVLINSSNFESIFGETSVVCTELGYSESESGLVSTEYIQSTGEKLNDVMSIYASIEKPLIINKYYQYANGNLQNYKYELKKLERGYPFIKALKYYQSKALKQARSKSQSCWATLNSSRQNCDDPDEHHTDPEACKKASKEAYAACMELVPKIIEQGLINEFSNNALKNMSFWNELSINDLGKFREIYMDYDGSVSSGASEMSINESMNLTEELYRKSVDSWDWWGKVEIATEWNTKLSTKHFYDFSKVKILDDAVYGTLDVVGLIPGLDTFTDPVGAIYAGVRQDGTNALIYSASFAVPFAGSAYIKGGANSLSKADELYGVIAKQANNDRGFVLEYKKISEISENELQLTSVIHSVDEKMTRKAAFDNVELYSDHDFIKRKVDDLAGISDLDNLISTIRNLDNVNPNKLNTLLENVDNLTDGAKGALLNKINDLGDGAASKFIDDFANKADDLASFSNKAELIDGWKRLIDSPDGVRLNINLLEDVSSWPVSWKISNGTVNGTIEVLDGNGISLARIFPDRVVASGRSVIGQPGNKILNRVPPIKNITYEVDGIDYLTDDLGRVIKTSGDLDDMVRVRLGNQQIRAVDVKDGVRGADQGGHIIAARFFGAGEQINYFSQAANLNQGPWKTMENIWADAMVNGSDVKVNIEPFYTGNSLRPNKIEVEYWIDDEYTFVEFDNL